MLVAVLILIFSIALFFFYLQASLQIILRLAFDREYFRTVVAANCLEFPPLRKAFEEPNGPVDYARLRMIIKCDFNALIFLLKHAANVNQRYSRQERLLIVYFGVVRASLIVRHWLRLSEKPAILELASILQYLAKTVGKRAASTRFGNLSTSAYLLSL